MEELNFEKMARKAVQNAFEDIVIQGKTGIEWLKIIDKLPPIRGGFFVLPLIN